MRLLIAIPDLGDVIEKGELPPKWGGSKGGHVMFAETR